MKNQKMVIQTAWLLIIHIKMLFSCEILYNSHIIWSYLSTVLCQLYLFISSDNYSRLHFYLQEARQAVGNIKNESLSEIRSLRAPPDIIRDILKGVLMLMGIYDTSWVSMKRYGSSSET